MSAAIDSYRRMSFIPGLREAAAIRDVAGLLATSRCRLKPGIESSRFDGYPNRDASDTARKFVRRRLPEL